MFQNIVKRSLYQCIYLQKYSYFHYINGLQKLHTTCFNFDRQTSISNDNIPSPAIASKYKVISEESSSIIENTSDEIYGNNDEVYNDEYEGLDLKRGVNGVFDIEALVELLKRESSRNIFVVTVPKEINYVEYIVIVTGKSSRHILALAEFVRKVYKQKCHSSDRIPRIEGKGSDEWMALDLGNIALHIFSAKTRKIYDLETLWAVGREYDEQINKKSDIVNIFENYSDYLKDLKPLE